MSGKENSFDEATETTRTTEGNYVLTLITQLRAQAAEIAAEGHDGWGNTMLWAADVLEAGRRD